MFTRVPADGSVLGTRLTLREPIRLELRDLSVGGVSGWTDAPLSRGERLQLTFPPAGRDPGRQARGRVVRCDTTASGYCVAVEFDHHM